MEINLRDNFLFGVRKYGRRTERILRNRTRKLCDSFFINKNAEIPITPLLGPSLQFNKNKNKNIQRTVFAIVLLNFQLRPHLLPTKTKQCSHTTIISSTRIF
jgi:hypothetical protein